jgi:hypothetical protein
MSWNDHDHRGKYAEDRHDHDNDYAGKYHRHYDDESTVRGLREDLGRAGERIRELADDLQAVRAEMLSRLAVLEAANARLAGALRGTAAWEASICQAGMASDERLAIASDLEEEFTALAAALEGEPEQERDAGAAAEAEAWGGRGPSASYGEWLAEGQQEEDR